jgi:hypothetical protein
MAKDEDDQDEGSAELKKLEKAIKTNRTMFFSLLVCAAVIISILITSVLVINFQLANRREVPAEEFADLLAELDKHLVHLSAIHNSEAKVYFEFQDSLADIKTLYQHEKINELRQLLVEREKDSRKLLDLMAEGTNSLANMAPGSREWTKAFSQKVIAEKQQSQTREKALLESMKIEKQASTPDDKTTGGEK